jgi:hypothetical protein
VSERMKGGVESFCLYLLPAFCSVLSACFYPDDFSPSPAPCLFDLPYMSSAEGLSHTIVCLSVCPFVGIGSPPHPLPLKRVCLPHRVPTLSPPSSTRGKAGRNHLNEEIKVGSVTVNVPYTVKKGSRVSRLQPGCH